jgi:hypothetical protein
VLILGDQEFKLLSKRFMFFNIKAFYSIAHGYAAHVAIGNTYLHFECSKDKFMWFVHLLSLMSRVNVPQISNILRA